MTSDLFVSQLFSVENALYCIVYIIDVSDRAIFILILDYFKVSNSRNICSNSKEVLQTEQSAPKKPVPLQSHSKLSRTSTHAPVLQSASAHASKANPVIYMYIGSILNMQINYMYII